MIEEQHGLDLQAKIKKDNPIIILNNSFLMEYVIVNGNHRIIGAIKDKIVNICAYVIPESMCKYCGLNSDYEQLYNLIENLYKTIYGIVKC